MRNRMFLCGCPKLPDRSFFPLLAVIGAPNSLGLFLTPTVVNVHKSPPNSQSASTFFAHFVLCAVPSYHTPPHTSHKSIAYRSKHSLGLNSATRQRGKSTIRSTHTNASKQYRVSCKLHHHLTQKKREEYDKTNKKQNKQTHNYKISNTYTSCTEVCWPRPA